MVNHSLQVAQHAVVAVGYCKDSVYDIRSRQVQALFGDFGIGEVEK